MSGSPQFADNQPVPTIALIVGITGPDGAYLARFLLEKGYDVYGTSRNIGLARTSEHLASATK